MSLAYGAVGWNRQKRIYDALALGGCLLYLGTFAGGGALLFPDATAETLLIRALGTCAFLLLHVVLAIGPLARLDRRFLPLLYNRRHLGVLTFALGLAHGAFSLVQFHALGNVNPLVSLLASNTRFDSLAQFPFQQLGLAALAILLLMAATSHDFWLKNLSPPVWKALHMLVYAAYALLVAHVAFGALQSEASAAAAAIPIAGALGLALLHLTAAQREGEVDRARWTPGEDGSLDVAAAADLKEGRAVVVAVGGERVAVFRHQGCVSAVSNVCRHQNGPLGEGRVIDGCITCPWHGYQYRPQDGRAPAPFTEKLATYRVRVAGGRVWVHPDALPPGTAVEPAAIGGEVGGNDITAPEPPFFVGYRPRAPGALVPFLRAAVAIALLIGLAIGGILSCAQRPFAAATFEYGELREFSGELWMEPVPRLIVGRPGGGAASDYLLVGFGKHGVQEDVRALHGQYATLSGTLIYRGARTMIEVVPDSARAAAPPPGWISERKESGTGGLVTLRGEIVDSKCYLGVMKPGQRKAHRDCAVRCILGGVPPVLVTESAPAGPESERGFYLLVGADFEAINERVAEYVAEPVEVTGTLCHRDGFDVLEVVEGGIVRVE